MSASADPREPRLSRRALFGAGVGRALDVPLTALASGSGPPRPSGSRRGEGGGLAYSWGEGDAALLGTQLRPAAVTLLEACAASSGDRVLDATAGDGLLAALAAARGMRVTAAEREVGLLERGRHRCAGQGLDVEWRQGSPVSLAGQDGGGFDAVISNFGVSHHPDQRTVTREMLAAARPGAMIAFTAWRGLMARVMTVVAPQRRGRSERWSRYETARLHFADHPDLDVREHSLEWHFDDVDDAVRRLLGPVAEPPAERRLREAMPELVERYGMAVGGSLVLISDYVVVVARKP